MTTRAASNTSSLAWVIGLPLAVILLFALNLFVFEPLLSRIANSAVAQILYIVIRIVGLIGLAFGLVKFGHRNRFQTVTTTLLVGFIDQVFLKGIWIKRDILANPEAWKGFEPTNAAVFVNMATGYLFFIPIVLILSFVGMESTRFRRDWSLKS